MPTIKIKRLTQTAILPTRATPGSSGWDLYADPSQVKTRETTLWIYPGEVVRLPTGLILEIPDGYEAQIRGRSGLGARGIGVPNGLGTIDSDYRGEIAVLLVNFGSDTIDVQISQAVAQMVICEVPPVAFEEVTAVSPSRRGTSGFGSTDKS